MTIQPERADEASSAAEPPAPGHRPVPVTPPEGIKAPPDLPQHKIRRTRISITWAATTCFAVVLLALLIFILQNSRTVEVSYFGAHGHLPLGVALLLSAVAGVLLVALPGSARIVQLRITARRHRRADAAVDGPRP
jgi:lipopolysaccharide assembly protein A